MNKLRVNSYNEQILDLIKKLVSFIIAEENKTLSNQKFYNENIEILKSNFLKYEEEEIICLLRRHRLFPLLSSSNLTNTILPNLTNQIKSFSIKEFNRTLFICSKLLEVNKLLNSEKIPFLVIKGIPLSIQTTNNLISRGAGDIDIFIDPSSINKVSEILKEKGFRKSTPYINYSNSVIGKYITFVSPEVMFRKNYPEINFSLDLDIHWRLSSVKGPNPSFKTSWNRKKQIIIKNQKINVLSIEDAFIHSCLHAAQDEFMSIRSLIDIERLSRKIDKKNIKNLSKLNVVKSASCLSFDSTNSENLKFFYPASNLYFKYLIQKTKRLQLTEIKYMSTSSWTLKNRIKVGFRILQFTKNPIDWLRVILLNILSPESFVNYQNNQIIYNPLIILKLRFKRLLQKIKLNINHKSESNN